LVDSDLGTLEERNEVKDTELAEEREKLRKGKRKT
jgi:hypothetical protein